VEGTRVLRESIGRKGLINGVEIREQKTAGEFLIKKEPKQSRDCGGIARKKKNEEAHRARL